MTATKKKNTKSASSPAPATKTVAAKPVAKKKPAVVARPKATASKATVPMAVSAPMEAKTVIVQAVENRSVITTITAQIDVGFGNALYLRGEGGGLSWDAGTPMECIGSELWRITLGESVHGFIFKFLVNDVSWSLGPDYTVGNGATATFTPEFQG